MKGTIRVSVRGEPQDSRNGKRGENWGAACMVGKSAGLVSLVLWLLKRLSLGRRFPRAP